MKTISRRMTSQLSNSQLSASQLLAIIVVSILFISNQSSVAQVAPPPGLGETTKGTPAILDDKKSTTPDDQHNPSSTNKPSESQEQKSIADNLLGTAKVKELRRENGQIYRIELEHSSGSKQVLEDSDSDGNFGDDDNSLGNAPKVAKWRIGSW